jgi:hypothetical protein
LRAAVRMLSSLRLASARFGPIGAVGVEISVELIMALKTGGYLRIVLEDASAYSGGDLHFSRVPRY